MAIINSMITGSGSLRVVNGITKTYQVANNEVVQKNSFVGFKDNSWDDQLIFLNSNEKIIMFLDENTFLSATTFTHSGSNLVLYYNKWDLSTGTPVQIGTTKTATICTLASNYSINTRNNDGLSIYFVTCPNGNVFAYFNYYTSSTYRWGGVILKYDTANDTFIQGTMSVISGTLTHTRTANIVINFERTDDGIIGYYYNLSQCLAISSDGNTITVGTASKLDIIQSISACGVIIDHINPDDVYEICYIEGVDSFPILTKPDGVYINSTSKILASIPQGYLFISTDSNIYYLKYDKTTHSLTLLNNPFDALVSSYWYIDSYNRMLLTNGGNLKIGTFLNGVFDVNEVSTSKTGSLSNLNMYITGNKTIFYSYSYSTLTTPNRSNYITKFNPDLYGTNRIYELPSTADFTEAPYFGLALEAGRGATETNSVTNVKVIVPSVYAE